MEKKKIIEWSFPEHKQYERSRAWYIAMLVVLGALMVYAVLTGNFLFAIILVLLAFISILQRMNPPLIMSASIGDKGLQVGKQYIPFSTLESFWMIYNPPETKMLYLGFKNGSRGNLAIPLEEANPVEIRNILKEFIEEDLSKEDEDLGDALERLLRI